ncbi:PREDICTED: uncharacterized protein At1g51745-like isoform X2 [Ipomoea nil]|uniref:uncharacterized protein At1g51745-like isoform X2 n=1 Tax=Ipomoea nil TaxID=35883 RepID=UPI000901EEAD|nr:PREDICTED: uncharacterized protein At1g51745-like isoform X2 [Ipomoea nil]
MGSSGECRAKPIDVPASGLVWVRRRNGQWWPGQILCPEELPERSSVSGRSGTPVKLLGLKDTCIDWHNLENSKRVRAFRCGEYDKCIEKALLVAASGSRKAVKYNRREDAILHALEIERSFLGKANPSFSLGLDKQNGGQNLIGELPASSREGIENVNGDYSSSEDNSRSKPKLSHSSVSFEGTNCRVRGQQKTPNDSEDDGIEGTQRMKGLDDLGMGVVQSVKRKRSQVVRINECLKKKSRCRPLTKVLQSTAMLSVPIMCEEVPSPIGAALDKALDGKAMVINNKSNSAGALCENGTSSNASGDSCGKCKQENEISETLEFAESGYSRRLFDVPFFAEGSSPIVPCASQKGEFSAGAPSSESGQVETMSCGSGEHNESGCTNLGNADILDSGPRMGKETSKWQSKGKRNFRTGNFIDWSRNSPHKESQMKGPTADLPIPRRSLPYRLSRFVVNPKYESPDFSLRHHVIADSSLTDVKVEVKSCYRTRHIPYISLMSKLNGQPITGHRLAVEVLDDGFCDHLDDDSAPKGVDMVNKTKLSFGGRLQPRASSTKSSKSKKESMLSKKVRRLSSLTGPRKQNREKNPTVQQLRGPTIACVPLKVVFSRIKAALNSSIRPAHRLIAPSIG